MIKIIFISDKKKLKLVFSSSAASHRSRAEPDIETETETETRHDPRSSENFSDVGSKKKSLRGIFVFVSFVAERKKLSDLKEKNDSLFLPMTGDQRPKL